MKFNKIFRKSIAITNQHGSWVFLLSPLVIGLWVGNSWSVSTVYLVAAALAGFMVQHPLTILFKAYTGRRSKRDFPSAFFWTAVYALIGGFAGIGLIIQGFSYLLILAVPGLIVMIWYLYLVYLRAERRQLGIELVASGVLALAAPAGYWVGVGAPDPLGWWLWVLTWLQSAASIVYAYLRLEQRELDQTPDLKKQIKMGTRAFAYVSFNLVAAGLLAGFDLLPDWIFIPYLIQWLETSWGITNPAVGKKPTQIGFRQLFVSVLFTLAFIITWNF